MGSKQPFERVVDEHGGTVLRVCRVLLGRHDADDAWSETFLAAMRAYPDLPETANVEAWLVTIAHRKTIDVLRARRRQPVPVGELPAEPAGTAVPGADAGDDGLWQAVRALPDKQRQAVAYHHGAALRRDRADPRRHHRGSPPGRRRWHQEPAQELPGRSPS
jgi:DNA-directed RNA polymerase specialized sigma24 family protein